MHLIKACRACLITNVKLYSMEDCFVYNAYLKLTGLISFESPDFICFECMALMKRFEDFRSKCMRAHALLVNFSRADIKITEDIILQIDRKENRLESQLKLSEMKTDYVHPTLTDISGFRNDSNENDEDDVPLKMGKMENGALDNNFYENTTMTHNSKIESRIKAEDKCDMVLVPSNDNDLDSVSLELNVDTGSPVSNIVKMKRRAPKSAKNKNGHIVKESKKPKTDHKERKRKKHSKLKIDSKNEGTNCLEVTDTEKEEIKNRKNKCISIEKKDSTNKKRSRPTLDESFFEGYATIVLLTPEQAKNEVLQRKDSSNYLNCQFKCDLCYRGFEAQSTYENHMKKHSPESGPHECAYCHMRFPGLSVLCRHRQSCHKRKFYCQICPYTCFCSHQAKIHVNLHKGKKYPCKECGEVFSMPNSLLMHKRIKHATECVCDLCGSTFTNERGLQSHKKMLHRQFNKKGQRNKHYLTDCGWNFHLETNARRGPTCEECGIQFSDETAWKRHLVLCSKHDVSNGCETCGDTFPDAMSLKEHVRTHTRRRHTSATATAVCVCEVCGKTFKELCFLVLHQRTHTGERPFACDKCGKAFPSPAALTSHRDTHTTSACYRCQLCTKRFTFRSSLYRHMKISHLGYRPHKCNMCDKMFPTPCQVRLHTKYVHDKLPWPKRERKRQPTATPGQEVVYSYDSSL